MPVDVEQVLVKLQDLNMIRLHRKTGKWFTIYCPFHNDGKERKPSCGVLLEDEVRNGAVYRAGMFHCFTCGYSKSLSGAVSDLLKQNSIGSDGEKWLRENVPGYDGTVDFDYLVPEGSLKSLMDVYAIQMMKYKVKDKQAFVSEEELASYRMVVPYMYERKMTDAAIAKFDVGVDMNFLPPGRKKPVPCLTFPVRDKDGNTLCIYRRSIQGKLFFNPEYVIKPIYGLYELDPSAKSVLICESIINVITAWVYGYPAVCMLGTGTSTQIEQLKRLGVHRFVICTDGDEAGRRSARKLRRELSSNAIIQTIEMPDGKDVNDCTKEEFDLLYQQRI